MGWMLSALSQISLGVPCPAMPGNGARTSGVLTAMPAMRDAAARISGKETSGSSIFRLSANGLKGINCLNAGKSLEVLGVESQNAENAMDLHGRNETGVVDLDSRNCMVDEEPAPQSVHSDAVGKQLEAGLNIDSSAICFRRR